jgi:acetoin utilization protein AcuB
MYVSDRMTCRPIVVAPAATLGAARDLMIKNDVRHLPVMAKRDLVGIITNRDILSVTSLATGGRGDLDRPVSDFMSTQVITVSPQMALEDAVRLLRKHHIAALPVMQGNRLVGIITEGDLLGALVDFACQKAHAIRIELTLPRDPEHFQRVCDLVTARGGKLHRAERQPRMKDRRIDVILEVTAPVVEKLVDAIEDAGYEIDLIVYR